jgi:hypothetical protein
MINSSNLEDRNKMLEYSNSIGSLLSEIAETDREKLKNIADSYLDDKRKNFSGLAYIDQLDKNYVYLERCVATMGVHVNLFLLGQERAPIEEGVSLVLNSFRLSTRDEVAAHMRYLAFGCDHCAFHSDHSRYTKLRELRLSNIDDYVDEIEFGCSYYKICLTLTQNSLVFLWGNEKYEGSFDWNKSKMNDIFYKYARHTTSCILNNLPLYTSDGKLSNFVVLDE